MQVRALDICEVKLLSPQLFRDERGLFTETYNQRTLAGLGIDITFVQDNHSVSRHAGTIRGLHYQLPPFAQAKIVRVVRGRILDVAVDIRRGSPSFGRSVAAEISAEAWNELFVPQGFAHGFCTLEDDTEVVYKASNYYSPAHERGLLWCDPELRIAWPVDPAKAVLNNKDRSFPRLKDAVDLFEFADA